LNETRARHPQHLEIWTDTLVTNVVFEPGQPVPGEPGAEKRRRAIG
jgi:hypothetical protein